MEQGPSSSYELLLPDKNKRSSLLISCLKWVLKIAIFGAFIAWILLVFAFPLESMSPVIEGWLDYFATTFIGFTGGAFLIFNGGVLAIALLSLVYLSLNSADEELHRKEERKSKRPSYSLWTFPVLVERPLGVVTAAESIGILLFAFYILYVAVVYAVQKLRVTFENVDYTTSDKWSWTSRMSGRAFGLAGAFCLSFLFISISRGSVILRVLNITCEHGIRYHIWLGNLCMVLFTCHGLFYLIGWIMAGEFPSELISWTPTDGANLAGIINIFFGWTIWITSLPFVRRKNFQLFYYTHHLYIIFIIFFAMHVGNFFFNIAAGGIFLFMIDRLLRFCQSKKSVDVISTRCLPGGVVELVLSKPANLGYNALSFLFVRVREVSLLQWHPFSVTSSPLDGDNFVSVLIKADGDWTSSLRNNVLKISEDYQALHENKITAFVEGPYGLEFPHHLAYEKLVLVAGGIGITPFISILSDILHRTKKGEPCGPKNILLVWAVKRSEEIPLLSAINMDSLSPFPYDKLQIEILIYVTREAQPPVGEGLNKAVTSPVFTSTNGSGISVLASTGNKVWYGLYIVSSMVGLFIFMSLLNVLFIVPYKVTNWWHQGLLLVASMVASVVLFGGAVIGLWHVWEERKLPSEKFGINEVEVEWGHQQRTTKNLLMEHLANSTRIHYHSRPDFIEIFGAMSKLWEDSDVGVMVCGPQTLESSVARECRSKNLTRQPTDPIFHFHGLSFSL